MTTNTGNPASRVTIRFDKAPAANAATEKPFERFEDALRQVLSVPKSEVDKRIKDQNEAGAERKPKG